MDPPQADAVAARLAQLLSDFDPEASEFLAVNEAALHAVVDTEAWPQFEALVRRYAFEEAGAQLEIARRRVRST